MPSTLQERLAESLARLRNPRTGADLFSTQQVRDIAATTSGRVRLTLLLADGDDPTLAKEVRDAVSRVQGVTDVELDVKPVAGAVRSGGGRTLPVIVGEVGHFADRPWTPPRDSVTAATRRVAETTPDMAFVSSEGLEHRGDSLHFSARAARELGARARTSSESSAPSRAGPCGQRIWRRGLWGGARSCGPSNLAGSPAGRQADTV